MRYAVTIALLALLLAVNPAFGAQRVVLIEDFTNWNCPPCDAIEDSMDALFGQWIAEGKAAPFRYHTWWPDGNDPMYHWPTATTDVQTKVSFYGVGYVPSFRYDGRTQIDPSDYGSYPAYYASLGAKMDSLLAVPAPIRFNFQQQRVLNQVNVSFDVIVEDASGIGTNQSLYMVVAEQNQNSIQGKQWYIFRDLQPSSTGHSLALVANDSLHFNWSYPTSSVLNPEKAVTLLFIQRGNNQVLQALYAPVSSPTEVASGLDPIRFRLEQNVPNPFNPLTTIPFQIKEGGNVRLSIFDASGRLVTDLVNGYQPSGTHEAIWRGSDMSGNPVASGVYYYRLDSGAASETRKMVMVR